MPDKQYSHLEDLKLLKNIENIFLEKRKYLCQLPQKNEAVILLLSGGLDSIVAWHSLLKDQIHVYPIIIKRKSFFKSDRHSVKYYAQQFEKQFPKHFHHPYYAKDSRVAQQEINQKIYGRRQIQNNSDEFLIEKLSNPFFGVEVFGQTTSFLLTAYNYAQLLEAKENLKVKTLITANLKTDGEAIKHQSISSIRLSNLLICFLANNWQIQVFSLFAEPSLKRWLSKEEIIKKFTKKENLDLSKTWSCYRDQLFHCGECVSCWQRKNAFKKVGVKDQTIYLDQIKNKITYHWQKLKRKIKNVFS